MSKKLFSMSIICAMLTTSFVLVGITVLKSKPKPVHASFEQKPEEPDPPGTINGAKNPELIPDHVAWSVVLGVIARQKTAEEKTRIRAYIRMLGVGRGKSLERSGAKQPDPEAEIDKLIKVAQEFETERNAIDAAAGFTAQSHRSLSAQELMSRANNVRKQKDQLVAKKVALLSQNLIPADYLALINSLARVKHGMKIVTYKSMPPSK